MATHCLTTLTPTPHVTDVTRDMSPPTRRRTLIAAAGSIILGTGVTAGAAASVADLVPASPNAELIAIGDEARTLCDRHKAVMAEWWRMDASDPGLERVAEAAVVPHERLCELSDQALELRAVTPAGWQAKAELLRHFLIVECESEGEMVFHSSEQELAWSLVCDMTGRA